MASFTKNFKDAMLKDGEWVLKLRSKCKNHKETNDEIDKLREELNDKRNEELTTDWQSKISRVSDRVNVLFNKKTLSDVTFLVGKQPKVTSFYAHKFILSISSPVFDAWFNHETWSHNRLANQEIKLTDEEPEAFRNLLSFIYTDEVNVNANNVLDTLYSAKKYCMTYLEKACSNFLETCLDPTSAFFLLTKARMFNESELAENCLEYIDIRPDTFNTDGFLETTEDIICEILKRNTLHVPEIVLYKSILKWAKAECMRKQIADTNENLRKILRKNIIQLIRFPLISLEDFSNECVSKNQILTETEMINMFLYLNVNPKPSIEPFSASPRYKSIFIEHSLCRFNDAKSRWGYTGSPDKIRFSADRVIYVTGFGLYGSAHTSSEYSCTIQLIRAESVSIIAENRTRFYSDGSKSIFKAAFREPVEIEPNRQYTACVMLMGPDTFYGVNGQKTVSYQISKKETVNFTFYYESACNNGTSVEDGQVPTIYFYTGTRLSNNKSLNSAI